MFTLYLQFPKGELYHFWCCVWAQTEDNVSATVFKTDGKICCPSEEVYKALAQHLSCTFSQSNGICAGFSFEDSYDCLAGRCLTEEKVADAFHKLKTKISTMGFQILYNQRLQRYFSP